MATLLLTAAGTLVGGPLGGALGALAGRSIDGAILGGGRREGPRLKELTLTTSSYGQPIPRHHGRMRAGGAIVWATELVEHAEKAGGKKGRPAVTTYAYTTSFAVALASRPIVGVGRVWADGSLLRGAAGDLKVPGLLRVHRGHGDQAPDPLIAAAEGAACPAFRGLAYAVFEDLALADFGNRIPVLSFEIVADEGPITLNELVSPLALTRADGGTLAQLAGFTNEGGPLHAVLATIDTAFPLVCDASGAGLQIACAEPAGGEAAPLLPPAALGWDEGDFGREDGVAETRGAPAGERIEALRYYDVARDFQPGVQRAGGRGGTGRAGTIEFPGALAADDARSLAEAAARRGGWQRERLMWRIAELDPALTPGRAVRVPHRPGLWRIAEWEWRSRGVELELVRSDPLALPARATDPGHLPPPPDSTPGPTVLAAYELPPAGLDPAEPTLFAAATAEAGAWAGAALFVERDGELVPVGRSGRERATIGRLERALEPSSGLLFEPQASLDLTLEGEGAGFSPAGIAGLALGANRLLVGAEVLQFARAEPVGPRGWRLSGLLRGRGGTEPAALAGHPAGTRAILIDGAATALDRAAVAAGPATVMAAIGRGDAEPVYAPLVNAGAARRPPCPVHPRARAEGGGLALGWTRRARGAWLWQDEVDTPLVEQDERYRVGVGPPEAPIAEWLADRPELTLAPATVAELAARQPGAPVWVRQIGSFAQSDPLLLARLP